MILRCMASALALVLCGCAARVGLEIKCEGDRILCDLKMDREVIWE